MQLVFTEVYENKISLHKNIISSILNMGSCHCVQNAVWGGIFFSTQCFFAKTRKCHAFFRAAHDWAFLSLYLTKSYSWGFIQKIASELQEYCRFKCTVKAYSGSNRGYTGAPPPPWGCDNCTDSKREWN